MKNLSTFKVKYVMLMLFQKHFAILNNTIRLTHNNLYTHHGEGIWRFTMNNSKRTAQQVTIASEAMSSNEVILTLGNTPSSLIDMADYVEISVNGKCLPVGEHKLSFPITFEDGTTSTIEISMTAWLNKEHGKACLTAKQEALEEEKKQADLKRKVEALQSMTPEQMMAMMLGNLDKLKI